MVARETLLTALEFVGVLGLFAIAYVVESTALWLAWALVTAALTGVTLLHLNWDSDPPPAS